MVYRTGDPAARAKRERAFLDHQASDASKSGGESTRCQVDGASGVGRRVPGLSEVEADRLVSSILDTIPAEEIFVFGSRARGDYGPDSDIDVFIVAEDDSAWAHAKARMALNWLKMPKDVLVESKDLYNKGSSRFGYVEHEVAREGIRLYG